MQKITTTRDDWLMVAIGVSLGALLLGIFVPPEPFWLLDTHDGIWSGMDSVSLHTGIPPEWLFALSCGGLALVFILIAVCLKYLTTPHK